MDDADVKKEESVVGSDWQPARMGGNPTTGFGMDKSPPFKVYKKQPDEADPAQQQAQNGPPEHNQGLAKVPLYLGQKALFAGKRTCSCILCCAILVSWSMTKRAALTWYGIARGMAALELGRRARQASLRQRCLQQGATAKIGATSAVVQAMAARIKQGLANTL